MYILYYSGESSRTTHALQVCIDACRYFGFILYQALNGENKESILSPIKLDFITTEEIIRIANGN